MFPSKQLQEIKILIFDYFEKFHQECPLKLQLKRKTGLKSENHYLNCTDCNNN